MGRTCFCEGEVLDTYGAFPGGDPRCFQPDSIDEGTRPEEMAAWEEACKKREVLPRQGCEWLASGVKLVRLAFGYGRYTGPCPSCLEPWQYEQRVTAFLAGVGDG